MPDVDVAVVDAEMSITMTMIFRSCPPWAEHKSLLGSVPFWTRARHNVRTEANANANDIGSSSPGIFILDDLRRRHRDNPAAAAGRDECLQGANSSGSRCVAITWATTSITYSLSLSFIVTRCLFLAVNAGKCIYRGDELKAGVNNGIPPCQRLTCNEDGSILIEGWVWPGTHSHIHTHIHTHKERDTHSHKRSTHKHLKCFALITRRQRWR